METFNNNQIKHLEMVQIIINRMSSICFQLKTIFITLLSGLLALFFNLKISEISILFILILTTLVFWRLDSYYLSLERQYRNLYNIIIKDPKNKIISLFDLTPIKSKEASFWICFRSKTIIAFYPLILIVAVLMFLLN